MNRRALSPIAACLAGLVLGGTARAQEPFLPGQVKSQALAEWVWHPDCVHVGVAPFTGGVTGERLGEAYVGRCSLAVDWAAVRAANAGMMAHASTIRRIDEIQTCTIIVHEYGHLAGYYDPVGFTEPDGTVDHLHSPDPHNVMYPTPAFSYPPCRALFPRLARHRDIAARRPDLNLRRVGDRLPR